MRAATASNFEKKSSMYRSGYVPCFFARVPCLASQPVNLTKNLFMRPALVLILCALSACAKSVLIIPVDERDQPLPDAQVIIDSTGEHKGATRVELDASGPLDVLISQSPEYLPQSVRIDSNSGREVRVMLRKDGSLSDTIPSDESEIAPNQWLSVRISDSYALRNEWWRELVEQLVSHDFQLSLLDERSGYVTTHWRELSYSGEQGSESHTVRRRIRGNLVSSSPLVYRVRIDVEHKLPGEKSFSAWNRLYREDLGMLREFIATMERPEQVM
jgi:hypothetical protein